MTTLYLIRHAQQDWDRVTPDEKWPLTPLGHEQAKTLATQLKLLQPNGLWRSKTLRASQTLQPFIECAGMQLNHHADLRERRLTWPPPPMDEMVEHYRKSWADLDYVLPDGESNREAQSRFMAALHTIVSQESESPIVVCALGNVIALAVHATLGFWDERPIDYCEGFTLKFDCGEWKYAGELSELEA